MKRPGICIAAAVAIATFSSPAVAESSSRLVVYLRADVAPFCHVWTTDNGDAVQLDNGQAALGTVREVCNTAGYVIRADFSNIDAGAVVAGGETAPVDMDGTARFSYGEARAQTRDWRLTNARTVRPDAPVYLRLSISPL